MYIFWGIILPLAFVLFTRWMSLTHFDFIPTALERYHVDSFSGLNKRKCRLHIPKGEKDIIKDWLIYSKFKFIIDDI